MLVDRAVKGVLFDLDGTLVDSVPDLAQSVNYAMHQLGRPLHPVDLVRQWVGNGMDRLLHRALTETDGGDADAELHAVAKRHFSTWYGQHFADQSRLYAGVLDILDTLQGRDVKLGCVTNKPIGFTLPLLKQLGIHHYFAAVVGGDSTPAVKPDPLPILHCCELLDLSPEQCLMVGDSINDFLAGSRAEAATIMVDYGYNQGIDLSTLDCSGVISHLNELHSIGKQHC